MNPSYSPGGGRLPASVAVTLLCAPAARVKVEGETVTEAGAESRACTAKVNVAWAPLTLESVRVLGAGSEPKTSGPKARVGGLTAAAMPTASPTLSLPATTEFMRATAPFGSATSCVAVLTTADLSCAGVIPGFFCFTSATAPATNGTAKLVPETTAYPLAL